MPDQMSYKGHWQELEHFIKGQIDNMCDNIKKYIYAFSHVTQHNRALDRIDHAEAKQNIQTGNNFNKQWRNIFPILIRFPGNVHCSVTFYFSAFNGSIHLQIKTSVNVHN